jgi:hypothetical protein
MVVENSVDMFGPHRKPRRLFFVFLSILIVDSARASELRTLGRGIHTGDRRDE